MSDWVIEEGVQCVVCPDCAFTFDASHTDPDGGYSCPNCEVKPTVHEVMLSQGIDRQRLKDALDARDNWGKMIHAFEFLTAASAVLATWPEEGDDGTRR